MAERDGTGNLPLVGQLDLRRLFDGINCRVIRGDQLTLAVVELDPGAIVPEHRHDNEQFGLVLEGTVTFTVGDETQASSARAASGAFPRRSRTRSWPARTAPSRSTSSRRPASTGTGSSAAPERAPRWPS